MDCLTPRPVGVRLLERGNPAGGNFPRHSNPSPWANTAPRQYNLSREGRSPSRNRARKATSAELANDVTLPGETSPENPAADPFSPGNWSRTPKFSRGNTRNRSRINGAASAISFSAADTGSHFAVELEPR